MARTRAHLWRVIGSIGLASACASVDPPRRAHTATVASPVIAPSLEPAPSPEPVDEPMPASEPAVEAAPASEPVVACADDPVRDPSQKPDHVVQLVELAAGMTVVDLGSGAGYFLCRLSRAVGPRGRVIATEIGRRRVRKLEQRVAREDLANVAVVRAPTDDLGIAAGAADRILLVNVWHHLRRRERYAARVARALAPGGKVIVVDFPPRSRGDAHAIAPERVLAELAAGGFDAAVVTEELSAQYVIVATRDRASR